MVAEASVVLPTRNGAEYLDECLGAVFAQRPPFEFEVIAIDSGSTDGSLEILRRYPLRLEQIPEQEFNHGGTRNLGVQLARGRYVVVMSQDAVPRTEHWLETLVAGFEDEQVAGVYCRQIARPDADVLTARNLAEQWVGRPERRVSWAESAAAFRALAPLERLRLATFDSVCGCLRRSVWERIPYPTTYFAEDLGWGRHAIEAGYKLVYEPRAAVVHSHQRRPAYEYRRTYLCHRRLFELFEVRTVPSLGSAVRLFAHDVLRDAAYVLRHGRGVRQRITLLGQTPAKTAARVLGQYLGARSQLRGSPVKYSA